MLKSTSYLKCITPKRKYSTITFQKEIEKSAEVIQNADAILIAAGAGMGVDSGLPDFRGNEGFWKAYPPLKDLNISFQQMANPAWFKKDPTLAWGFYGHRQNLYRKTIPHKGFQLLKNWTEAKKHFIYTSNVDGQFQKAGFSENQILEVHGSIHHLQCSDPKCCPGDKKIISAEHVNINVDPVTFRAEPKTIPKCVEQGCDFIARPNLLMFGDWNWLSERTDKQDRRFYQWLSSLITNKEKVVIIELGAGLHVPTVRQHSEMAAYETKGTLVRINPRDPEMPGHVNGISIPMNSLVTLEEINKLLKK